MLSIKSPRTLQTLEIKESINQHKKNKYTYQVAEGGSLLLFVCLVIQLGCVCVCLLFVCGFVSCYYPCLLPVFQWEYINHT